MIVVDASVWVAFVLKDDEFNTRSESWFDAATDCAEVLAAPLIVLPEIAGALRRRTGNVTIADRGLSIVGRIDGLALHSVDASLADLAARLAADLGLKGADAVYVALADRLGCPLVTWDAEMIRKTTGTIEARQPTV